MALSKWAEHLFKFYEKHSKTDTGRSIDDFRIKLLFL